MPTYSYACATCGHRFDAVQSIHDHTSPACPECGSEVRKVFGSVGVTFKGSGFYRTDSREKPSASHQKTSAPREKPAASAPSSE